MPPRAPRAGGGGSGGDQKGRRQESHTGGGIIRKLKACKGPGSGSSVQRRLMSVGRTEKGRGTGWSQANDASEDASAWFVSRPPGFVPVCAL